jgi:hypothetical protein
LQIVPVGCIVCSDNIVVDAACTKCLEVGPACADSYCFVVFLYPHCLKNLTYVWSCFPLCEHARHVLGMYGYDVYWPVLNKALLLHEDTNEFAPHGWEAIANTNQLTGAMSSGSTWVLQQQSSYYKYGVTRHRFALWFENLTLGAAPLIFSRGCFDCARNQQIGIYFVDFLVLRHKVGIECEEHGHKGNDSVADEKRTGYIKSRGYPIFSFNPDAPKFDVDNLLCDVLHAAAGRHGSVYGVGNPSRLPPCKTTQLGVSMLSPSTSERYVGHMIAGVSAPISTRPIQDDWGGRQGIRQLLGNQNAPYDAKISMHLDAAAVFGQLMLSQCCPVTAGKCQLFAASTKCKKLHRVEPTSLSRCRQPLAHNAAEPDTRGQHVATLVLATSSL